MNDRVKTIVTSKTFWGAVLGAAAYLVAQPHIGVTEIVQALGPVLAAIGLRDAVAKASAEK